MKVKKVWAAYFSATGTTEKVVKGLAKSLAKKLKTEWDCFDFTLPKARKLEMPFQEEDVVVFGTPTIAGRVPNVLLKYLATIEGRGALAIPISLYGNRNYDDCLIELRDILAKAHFYPIAAGAFIGEHSFSKILGAGRPDEKDMKIVEEFADKIVNKIATGDRTLIEVKGTPDPYRWYYQPRDRQGNPVDIRKVKPLTNEKCTDCKICAKVCPMGSISFENVREIPGICIKCCACIKKCPEDAKYYEDEGYLYHQHELEEEYIRRAEPEYFV
ncbi:ferredoxin [Fusobacterium necrophorum]|uniref:Ferredoxin n=1 Tax=Fusobacterium necrophorum BL TaxID=1441732 RepID=A0AB73BY84_9FUSO|nr:EFR1 family ferrodoxin [Fusobacterium necrophorum]AYZ74377.1 ferredoxin [Fusobacterium necrophorum]AZW09737.1 ferredoxin [Fusobacterium necrophorum subsp. necrophorum]KDE64217.1 ferredoxin [Fusobacterium necrophorum BL]KDE66206.1 ferredoxin [Fusobacterium necrophorum BFTR-1]SDB11311.1 4Fe-4S binding domain-containing protein [Fusobacterium necrophorum]